jgi:hypothetical protein
LVHGKAVCGYNQPEVELAAAIQNSNSGCSAAPSTGESRRGLCWLLAALPDNLAEFQSRCSNVEDWREIFAAAEDGDVLGFLYSYLSRAGVEISAELQRRVERRLTFQRMAQSRAPAALDEVLEALGAAGIQAAVLKGPALAERLYPDPLSRLCSDLDILVSPRNLNLATAALQRIGFRIPSGPAEQYYRTHHHHIHLERPPGPMVELHFWAYRGFGTGIDAGELLARASRYRTAGGASTWVLSPEDEILYLCAHIAGHRFQGVSGLYELKLYACRYPNLEWAVVARRARSVGLLSVLRFTCELFKKRFGVPLAKDSALGSLPFYRAFPAGRFLSLHTTQPKSSIAATLAKWAYFVVLCDRPGAAVRYLGHTVSWVARRRAARRFPGLVPESWLA